MMRTPPGSSEIDGIRPTDRPRRNRRWRARLTLAAALLGVLGAAVSAQPAWADGGQSSEEGYVMVQQALSYLVNEPGPGGITDALMKVDLALAAKDQQGVAVGKVEQAKVALQAGDAPAAQALLQDSIAEAIGALKPAVGSETGTTVVLGPLPPRGPLGLIDWLLLAFSVVLVGAGGALAILFRPREGLRELSLDIVTARGLTRAEDDSIGRESDAR